jgi:glycosyltransferase involved in cell wall biosynthesis
LDQQYLVKDDASAEMVLSVVVICKNEERFIADCIESVLNSTRSIRKKEVIVVDSCSEDRTIQIAGRYPITILQLRPGWTHTPSAGRYIGYLNSSGRYVFFIDGDSILIDGFMEKAIKSINLNDRLGAVTGKRHEACYSADGSVQRRNDIYQIGDSEKYLDIARCSSLFKRSALEKAGSFNPYIYSEEEAELSDRMKRVGYQILGIPFDMVVHNITVRADTLKGMARRIHMRFNLGPGQIMRCRLREGMSSELFRRISGGMYPLGWLLVGLLTGVLALAFGKAVPFLVWLALSLLLVIVIALKARSLRGALKNIAIWITYGYSFLLGFMIWPKKANNYPRDVLKIKVNNESPIDRN